MSEATHSSVVDIGPVVRALDSAPSVHATQPWLIEPFVDGVDLVERTDIQLPFHDPHCRDRAMSCGAALTNLVVAVRAQGLTAQVALLPDPDRPELVARVTASGVAPPTGIDLAQHAAIDHRHSHRAPFSVRGLTWLDREALVSAASGNGVTAHVIRRQETFPLADLLDYAGLAFRDDPGYQRELAAWLPVFPHPFRTASTLPWSGLVHNDTHVPDRYVLAERLRHECLLVVLTATDTRRDHLLAGMALQRSWLTAVSRGLVASVVTQPWQLPEVRDSLSLLLGRRGFPQAMLRVGRRIVNSDL
ncbi:MAG TPA: hypothetical protein VFX16_33930 [Pseudonocardiaceae bacterium]|nr:hypothetical protein [Pseudonocardiaceae bacterium]